MKKVITIIILLLQLQLTSCSFNKKGNQLIGLWEVYDFQSMTNNDSTATGYENLEIIGTTYYFHPNGELNINPDNDGYLTTPKWEYLSDEGAVQLTAIMQNRDSINLICKIEQIDDSTIKMFSPKYYPPFVYFLHKLK